ncbi:MAG TPA: DUF5615 family PIN-like protein [Fimbriimonadaceae bacterium]|nr:DUF5615 family PIN-like protein [Fimbriimonadaceae bacterium]
MKFLIDVCLSPLWVETFKGSGFEAVHWTTIGPKDAEDTAILDWARQEDHVVFTHDLDFGAILTSRRASGPSVVQLREQETDPEIVGDVVIAAIRQLLPQIESGALITIDLKRAKARILPIVP